jgi:hypothetical protein
MRIENKPSFGNHAKSRLSFAQMPSTRPDSPFAHVIDAVERIAANVGEAPRALRQPWFAMPVPIAQPPQSPAAARAQAARHYGTGAAFGEGHTDRAEIARELGVDAGSSRAAIGEARRRFALRNHPDRAPHALREIATARMAFANEMLDAWLERE